MLGPSLLSRALVSFSQDFLAGNQVSPEHFGEENVVNLDVVSRDAVVQERRWEHHVVPVEPELNSILGVESVLVSGSGEAAPREDHESREEVDEKAGVIEGSVASKAEETRSNTSHASVDLENSHPEIVHYSKSSMQGMG